ncbi:MAG TPA: PKD domain-containing protein, partial [Saprospiraceae bacterium]|nr:PKD domain-containing protein [Saprospiraceae bacterium]
MSTPLLFTLAVLIYLFPRISIAQTEFPYGSAQDAILPEWAKLMYSPSPDPGQVVDAYNVYYNTQPFVKNGHTQFYKRWLRSMSRELPPLKSPRVHRTQNRSSLAQWQSIGPWDWDHDAADRSYAPGAAHVYTVEQAISNPDILYAGTATAGLWKSEDRGLSWISVSDALRTGSVTALEINHLQSQTVYAELLKSIYKSTNGGDDWNKTGDIVFQAMTLEVNDLVMHPTDTATLFAATHLALYRSTNGGSTWILILPGDFLEIEFHPTQPDTLYAVRHIGDKTEFYRSLDGGNTFQIQITGWPNPNILLSEHQQRTEIAVSPDAPDYVYALATGLANGGSGLYGIYVSEDAGQTWSFTCCGDGPAGPPSLDNPNLMGWSDDGTDDGGQYYYDLAFDVSPTNADSVYVGGVNLWVSDNGGESFVCPAKWSHPHKPNYVHADIHDIHFYPGTQEIWLAGDGGIFCSSNEGASFARKMSGITGTDFWGFGAGYWDGEVMLGGTYHNGTLLKDNDVYLNGWISTDGGDNFRGFVNPGKPRQVYSDYNIKTLSGDRVVNNGTRPFPNKPNASYIIGESSDMLFHPQYFGTWYSGYSNKLWKTEDDGYTFTMIHDFGANVAAMDIAWSNPDVMYVCTWPGWWSTKRIYRSDDSGENWIEITPSSAQLGGNTWVPYDIAVDALNPMKVWIVRTSMYHNTNLNGIAVFTSDNGGSTWQNMTTYALNDEAFTCIMHQAGTNGGIYIGTRESVYYRNASMTDWAWYGDGLPEATFSTRLLPYYREGKLRNSTNRSVWESPLYESSSPIAMPSTITRRHDCIQDTVYFMDHSVVNENDASWFWQFPGATPATSDERNPKVLYNATGIYDVTLTVSDINGTDSHTATGMIEVRNWCVLDEVPGKALKSTAYPDYTIVPDLGLSGNTITISAWV